jgi:hypothetical protein
MQHIRRLFIVSIVAAIATVATAWTAQSQNSSAATATTAQVPTIQPEAFHTAYRLETKTGDGRDMVVQSGWAEIDGKDLKGNSDGTWNRKDLAFRVGPDWSFSEWVYVVPVVSPASIMNVGVATNAGWAVDSCDVIRVDTPALKKQHIVLKCRVGVRDADGYMFRVNYYITMVGRRL